MERDGCMILGMIKPPPNPSARRNGRYSLFYFISLRKHLMRRQFGTGQIPPYNQDDENITLREMLRQEKFSAGATEQKDLDVQFAKAIMSDGKFEVFGVYFQFHRN